MWSSENLLAFLNLAVGRAGESEIADFGIGVEIQQDVGGFDVPVDDAVVVGLLQSFGNLYDIFNHLFNL